MLYKASYLEANQGEETFVVMKAYALFSSILFLISSSLLSPFTSDAMSTLPTFSSPCALDIIEFANLTF